MGFAGLNNTEYDAIEDNDGFAPIPKGAYQAEIAEASESTTAAGDTAIKIQWKIHGPKFANRRMFQTLVVGHSKEKVANIAKAQVKNLGRWNGLDGRFPESGKEMAGWKAVILTGFYQVDDGRVFESVNGCRRPSATAHGPDEDQPELYAEAVKQYETGAPAYGAKTDIDDDDGIPF